MSDPTSSTPSVESTPTVKPLPVPGPGDDPAPLRHFADKSDGEWVCPHCSAVLEATAKFCEVCGYDPTTGSLPAAVVPAPSPLKEPTAATAARPRSRSRAVSSSP